ncbi:hypothetical protein Dimus_004216 [Dionaea muscipula]
MGRIGDFDQQQMQDLAAFAQLKPQFPEQEQLKCPRCESTNTKFCYYNNYNLSQPRHYCKSCRRYWTKGGALRNIPIGGGTRKNTTKRSSISKRQNQTTTNSSPPAATIPSTKNPSPKPKPDSAPGSSLTGADDDQQGENRMVMDMPGSFGSLFGSNPQFGNFMFGFDSSESGVRFGGDLNMGSREEFGLGRKMGFELEGNSSHGGSEGFLGNLQIRDSNYWANVNGNGNGNSNCNGWTDLAI